MSDFTDVHTLHQKGCRYFYPVGDNTMHLPLTMSITLPELDFQFPLQIQILFFVFVHPNSYATN